MCISIITYTHNNLQDSFYYTYFIDKKTEV